MPRQNNHVDTVAYSCTFNNHVNKFNAPVNNFKYKLCHVFTAKDGGTHEITIRYRFGSYWMSISLVENYGNKLMMTFMVSIFGAVRFKVQSCTTSRLRIALK